MPIHELTGPDGNTYELTVPEGASPEDIAAAGRNAVHAITTLSQPGGSMVIDPNGPRQFAPAPNTSEGAFLDNSSDVQVPEENKNKSVTSTRVSKPGELSPSSAPRNIIGTAGAIRGAMLGGETGAELGAPFFPPFGSIAGGVGGALFGAGAGGLLGGAVGESVAPSASPILPRLPFAAAEQGRRGLEMESLNQLGLRPLGALIGRGAQFVVEHTPTGGVANRAAREAQKVFGSTLAAERAKVAENVGQGISEAGAANVAQTNAPAVSAMANSAVDNELAQAQQLANQGERAIPGRIATRSDRLAGPVPRPVTLQTYEPRTLGAQPGQTVQWTRPPRMSVPEELPPLGQRDIPDATMIPRRANEVQGGIAEDTAGVLDNLRNTHGAINTVRRLAANPDAQGVLFRAASTPAEREVLDWSIQSGKILSKSGAPNQLSDIPENIANAARQAMYDDLSQAKGKWGPVAKWLMFGGAMSVGMHGGQHTFAHVPAIVALEYTGAHLLDKAINSQWASYLGQAARGAAGTASRPAAAIAVREIDNRQPQGESP